VTDELLPGYRLRSHLSRGRALDVYEMWSEERGCLCVGKLVRPDRESERSPRRRLRREARLLLELTHPHIVRAYELLERPRLALVLEALTGETLARTIEDEPRLAVAELAALGTQLCSALGYLHSKGVLHLDLKPSNVIADCGQAKLIDLSVARAPGRARPGNGTRVYMAPEQARGGRVTAAADVWGLGALLYAAATGRRPFAAYGVEYPQLAGRAEPIGFARCLPRPLGAAIDACLDPSPRARPTVAQLISILEQLG
jgi:eukaryotic-like serine/threonine-protein kinase